MADTRPVLQLVPSGHRGPRPEAQRPEPQRPEPQRPEPLWREALGRRLRRVRRARGETLEQTASRAGISPQYLSEIERGVKDPSSEMIAAVAGALDLTLPTLTSAVAADLQRRPVSTRGVTLSVAA